MNRNRHPIALRIAKRFSALSSRLCFAIRFPLIPRAVLQACLNEQNRTLPAASKKDSDRFSTDMAKIDEFSTQKIDFFDHAMPGTPLSTRSARLGSAPAKIDPITNIADAKKRIRSVLLLLI
jgi:hypothetical protein